MDVALDSYPIHTRQHGFRKDRNTETALSAAVDLLERQLFLKRLAVGVFLDIRSAFDTMSSEQIGRSLLTSLGGIPTTLPTVILLTLPRGRHPPVQ